MELGKITHKSGRTWITLHINTGRYVVINLDCPATSVELKGTTLNVKTKRGGGIFG